MYISKNNKAKTAVIIAGGTTNTLGVTNDDHSDRMIIDPVNGNGIINIQLGTNSINADYVAISGHNLTNNGERNCFIYVSPDTLPLASYTLKNDNNIFIKLSKPATSSLQIHIEGDFNYNRSPYISQIAFGKVLPYFSQYGNFLFLNAMNREVNKSSTNSFLPSNNGELNKNFKQTLSINNIIDKDFQNDFLDFIEFAKYNNFFITESNLELFFEDQFTPGLPVSHPNPHEAQKCETCFDLDVNYKYNSSTKTLRDIVLKYNAYKGGL